MFPFLQDLFNASQVGFVVRQRFRQAIATELLDRGIGERERNHRLADDTCRRNGTDVRTNACRLDRLHGSNVDRA